MRLKQGQFSYLPDLTEEEVAAQVQYAIDNGWGIGIEYTDDPHPRNDYWQMYGRPRWGLDDPQDVLSELADCREANPEHYIAIRAYSNTRQRQGIMLDFIVNRPEYEPGFHLERRSSRAARVRYELHSYATEKPRGERYGATRS